MERIPLACEKISLISPGELDTSLDFSSKLNPFKTKDQELLLQGLERSGILSPILSIKKTGNPNPLVIDGFKRIKWALSSKIDTVCVITLPQMEEEELVVFLTTKYAPTLDTCVVRALFLYFLVEKSFKHKTIVEKVMPILGLEPHKGLLERYLKIAGLPHKLLLFCHEKDFSLKRCINLSYKPRRLLETIIGLNGVISLSASLLQELCDNIHDILRRDDMDVEAFFELKQVRDILGMEKDPSTKTRLLRRFVWQMRYPVLSSVHAQIEEIEKRHFSNMPFCIKWDRSLENRKITITGSVSSPNELDSLIDALSDKGTKEGINKMLARF